MTGLTTKAGAKRWIATRGRGRPDAETLAKVIKLLGGKRAYNAAVAESRGKKSKRSTPSKQKAPSKKKITTRIKTPAKRKPMSRSKKIARWGSIVATYKSSSGDKTWKVRKKDGSYTCNCPGWIYKRKGKDRSCKHVIKAAATGKRGYKSRRRKSRVRRSHKCRH